MDSPPLDQLGELEISDSKFAQFLIKYKQPLLYGFLSLLILLFGIQRFFASRASHQEQDFMNADIEFYQLQSQEAQRETALSQLQQVINSHHELHAKYDGAIAQNLLKQQNAASAKEYAGSALRRTSAQMGPYADFSETSLLIAEGRFDEALHQAQRLQETLSASLQLKKYHLLRAYNLLRLATLSQQLERKELERDYWQQIIRGLDEPAEMSQGFRAMSAHFQEGRVALKDYIQERLHALQ